MSDELAIEGRPKAKTFRPLLRLLPYLKANRAMLAVAGTALVFAAGATLALPLAVRRMIDVGFSQETRGVIAETFLFLVGLMFLLSLFSAARYYAVTWLGERVVADLRRDVFAHITRLSPAFFELTRTGEVLSRLTTDTTIIQAVVGANVSIALRNGLMLVGGLAMLFVTNWWLTLLMFGTVPLLVAPLILIGRWVRKLSRTAQDRLADTSAQAGEVIQGMTTVQAFGQEMAERARFDATNQAAFASAERRARARAVLIELVIFLVSLIVVAVLWVGASDVIAGEASAGELAQFIIYAVLTAGSLGALAEVWGELQRAAGATERLMELLATEPEIAAPAAPMVLPPGPQPIVFEGVSFAYPTRPEAGALKDFSLRIEPGETVALVGPSGAGKSTVFRLLLRFYDPQTGGIAIGGVDVRAAEPAAVRARFSLVAQDPVIFSGSIGANIAYGRAGAGRDAIEAAARAAHAEPFIRKLTKSYDTLLGERGVTLSGGERQRVALARALLRDAPVLLLDEATSSLDSETEAEIQMALEALKRGRTSLIIAHRLSTVVAADRIVVIDGGRIVAEGTHRSLLAESGLYARLARLQLLGDEAPARAQLAGE